MGGQGVLGNNFRSDLINCCILTFTENGINPLPIFITRSRWGNVARPPRSLLNEASAQAALILLTFCEKVTLFKGYLHFATQFGVID